MPNPAVQRINLKRTADFWEAAPGRARYLRAIGFAVAFGVSIAASPFTWGDTLERPDPNIVFIEPKPGQQFVPGDTLSITVRVLAPLKSKVTDADASVPGMGMLRDPKINWKDGVLRWRFEIPQGFAGPLMVNVSVVAGADPAHPDQPLSVDGAPVTVVVRPAGPPQSLQSGGNSFNFLAVGEKARVYVTGKLPGGSTYDLTTSVTGTVYASSDPAVIAVDAEGNVVAVGLGTASVRATNGGAKTFFAFVVKDAHPLPPQDLTARVRFEPSPLELDAAGTARAKTPIYAQTVSVTNTSDWPLIGPLHLVVRDLAKGGGWLYGYPPDQPSYYLRLSLNDGLTLRPGERVMTTLRFIALRSPTSPDYRLGVIGFDGDTGRPLETQPASFTRD